MKSGSLNLLEPSEPVQACNGMAMLPYFLTKHVINAAILGLFKFLMETKNWSAKQNISGWYKIQNSQTRHMFLAFGVSKQQRPLSRVWIKSSTTDTSSALIIYKSFLRPTLTNAPPLHPHGGYAKQTHINKLQTFQNNVLKIIQRFPAVTPTQILYKKSRVTA